MKFFHTSPAMVAVSQVILDSLHHLQVRDPESGSSQLDQSSLQDQEVQECQER